MTLCVRQCIQSHCCFLVLLSVIWWNTFQRERCDPQGATKYYCGLEIDNLNSSQTFYYLQWSTTFFATEAFYIFPVDFLSKFATENIVKLKLYKAALLVIPTMCDNFTRNGPVSIIQTVNAVSSCGIFSARWHCKIESHERNFGKFTRRFYYISQVICMCSFICMHQHAGRHQRQR